MEFLRLTLYNFSVRLSSFTAVSHAEARLFTTRTLTAYELILFSNTGH